MKFEGSSNYVATPDLTLAVNASMTLRRPLLVKGEPGTGKTMLAEEAAASLGLPLLEWHIKSTTKAQQGLYEYDAVSRLRDSQLGDPKVAEIANYIVRGKLWDAFDADRRGRAPPHRHHPLQQRKRAAGRLPAPLLLPLHPLPRPRDHGAHRRRSL